MDIKKMHKLSPTKCRILNILLTYRCLTVYQLHFLIDPTEIPLTYPFYSSEQLNMGKVRSMLNQLSQLQKNGLVTIAGKYSDHHDIRVFTLSEDGLSVAYSLLDIPQIKGYQRTGWDNDHGYFPYELYRPPKERLLKHHFLGIDFNVLMRLLAIKHNFNYDFIDNRYSSVEFTTKDGNHKEIDKVFRPDGEFIIKVNNGTRRFHCWVEFDMSTERTNILTEKFQKYGQFLNYMSTDIDRTALVTTIPDAVFFVTIAKQNIWSRWVNVQRSFLNNIGPWSTYLNLYVGNVESLENLILSHINSDDGYKKKLSSNLRPLLEDQRFIGQPKLSPGVNAGSFCYLFEHEVRAIGWEPFFTVTQVGNLHQVYLYVKCDEFETGGISQAIDFSRKLQNIESMKKINAKEVIPVLLYSEKRPHDLNFVGCDSELEFSTIFEKSLWHDVSTNKWFDRDGKEINTALKNPLTYFSSKN